MLSILIPTYNYNTLPLVTELFNQAIISKVEFEIIVLDDCSNLPSAENDKISHFKNTIFITNDKNTGRASTINKLVSLSKYENCLILEADSIPEKSNYLQQYLDLIKKGIKIAFGGVIYPSEKPQTDSLLRWIYGHERESKNISYRIKKPSNIIFSWNLLIDKATFNKYPFDSSIKDYGFEDLIFLKNLNDNEIKIHQIENNLIHLNSETSQKFIDKYHYSLKNLKRLIDTEKIKYKDTNLTKKYHLLKKWKAEIVFLFVFLILKKPILKNLNSKYCTILLFDLYKLGYFCSINKCNNV